MDKVAKKTATKKNVPAEKKKVSEKKLDRTIKINKNNKLILSICIIILYFLWPQVLNLIKNGLTLNETGTFIFDIISNILLIIVLIYLYKEDLAEYFYRFKNNKKKTILTILIFTFFTFAVNIAVNVFVQLVLKVDTVTANEKFFGTSFINHPILVTILTVFCCPIIEEIVFSKTLKDIINSKWLFIVISSLFFWYYSIAYNGSLNYLSIIGSLYCFAAGIVKNYAYYKTDNLYVPICIKLLINLLWVFK